MPKTDTGWLRAGLYGVAPLFALVGIVIGPASLAAIGFIVGFLCWLELDDIRHARNTAIDRERSNGLCPPPDAP